MTLQGDRETLRQRLKNLGDRLKSKEMKTVDSKLTQLIINAHKNMSANLNRFDSTELNNQLVNVSQLNKLISSFVSGPRHLPSPQNIAASTAYRKFEAACSAAEILSQSMVDVNFTIQQSLNKPQVFRGSTEGKQFVEEGKEIQTIIYKLDKINDERLKTNAALEKLKPTSIQQGLLVEGQIKQLTDKAVEFGGKHFEALKQMEILAKHLHEQITRINPQTTKPMVSPVSELMKNIVAIYNSAIAERKEETMGKSDTATVFLQERVNELNNHLKTYANHPSQQKLINNFAKTIADVDNETLASATKNDSGFLNFLRKKIIEPLIKLFKPSHSPKMFGDPNKGITEPITKSVNQLEKTVNNAENLQQNRAKNP